MKEIKIPFCPFPFRTIKQVSTHFEGFGQTISKSFPQLSLELEQAEIKIDAKDFGAIIFTLTLFYFVIITVIAALFTYRLAPDMLLFLPPTAGGVFALLIFIQLSVYPKIQVKKKVRDIERHLVFALRTILVEIKSSVTLFDAMNIIAIGNYGEISRAFKKTIEEINTGTIEEDALDEMGTKNPSLFFRRAIWQIVNGLKAGADVSAVISSLVESMEKEQKNEVKLYGSALKLLSLVYMMLGVIVPALGLTLLIILSTFPQITIDEIIFWVMLLMLIVAQFMYLGMIKSKRPNLIGE